MGWESDSRFAELRALLSQPERDAALILQMLRDWPDDPEKELAAQYVHNHFAQRDLQIPLRYYASSEDAKMLYDPKTKMLYTNEGQLIKEMACPLTKKWDQLQALEPSDFKRLCGDCNKYVVNTKGLSDQQVLAILKYDPEACLHVDQAHGNVTWLPFSETDERRTQTLDVRFIGRLPRTPGLRIIETARTPNEINRAAKEGYWPLVQHVEVSGRIGSFMQVWQHQSSGEVSIQTDMRYPSFSFDSDGDGDWEVVIPAFDFDPSCHFPSPVAAYLIPPDLVVGERVLLLDVIDNMIEGRHQGSYRLKQVEAIWDGTRFDVQFNEEEDAYVAVG